MRGRYDLKVSVDLNSEENALASARSIVEGRCLKKGKFNMDSIVHQLLSYNGLHVLFSSISEYKKKGLSCEDMRRSLKDVPFCDYYYIECLLSKKGRYSSHQLYEADLSLIRKQNIYDLCIFLCANIKVRFLNVKGLLEAFCIIKIREALTAVENQNSPTTESIDRSIFMVRSVIITPLTTIFNFPKGSTSNRVLREFDQDKFLRVSFREEDGKEIIKRGGEKRYGAGL
jgi:hypothetical protein